MIKIILATGVFLSSMQPVYPQYLQGNVTEYSTQVQEIGLQPQVPKTQFMVPVKKHQLSALGIVFRQTDGRILFVDPNSSVFGVINQGDYILTEDGVSAWQAVMQRINYGQEMTICQCVFKTIKGEITLNVIRKPIECFTPYIRSTLRPY